MNIGTIGTRILLVLALTAAPAIAEHEHGIPPPQAQAQAAASPAPVSLNAQFRALALAQGPLDPASWPTPPQAHDTGGHEAYGWNLAHLATAARIPGAIRSAAARPIFYDRAPFRLAGYCSGGRPQGYVPETDADMPLGLSEGSGAWRAPGGLLVDGIDNEHADAIFPLFAIARSSGFTVATPAGPRRAELVARDLLRHMLPAHIGMFRTKAGLVGYVPSGRVTRWLLGSMVEGASLGVLRPEDAATALAYLQERVLPAIETGPPPLRVYNDLCWVLPALYDVWRVCPDRALRGRIWSAMQTLAGREARLAQLVPGQACQVEQVTTWGPELTREGVSLLWYVEEWEIRSKFVAAEVLGVESPAGAACLAEAKVAAARQKGNPAARGWRVDAEGVPLP